MTDSLSTLSTLEAVAEVSPAPVVTAPLVTAPIGQAPIVTGSVPDAVLPPPAAMTVTAPEVPPILIADDDPDDTFFIQRLIKKTGVANPVKVFDDGSEVVNYLGARAATACGRRRVPLLLFLDLKMAGLGGFGFLEWARQQKNLMPLTIVVLSNSNEPADFARALELGAHRYLVKYPSVQTVSTIVRSVYPQVVF